LETAKVTDKAVSKEELYAEDDLPEGYGDADAKPAKKAAKAAKTEDATAEKPAKKPAAKKAKAAE
jgi:trigger factor